MTVRETPLRHKSLLTVKQLLTTVVKLIAKAIQGARAYEWQYSVDGGVTWINLPTTAQANTTVSGLKPGVVTHFRFRVLTKDGLSDWGDAVDHLVT
jgi:hypothetical protein